MQAVSIEQILALLVAFDPTLCAAHALPGQSPQKPLALKAVGRGAGRPHHKVVRRCTRDGVDQRLQGLLVHVHFLKDVQTTWES